MSTFNSVKYSLLNSEKSQFNLIFYPVVIIVIVIFLFYSLADAGILTIPEIAPLAHSNLNLNECPLRRWNKIRTDFIPNDDAHKFWQQRGVGRKDNFYHKSPSPFAAYAYKDHIAVTMTNENSYGKQMFCRYFDCMQREIGDPFESSVFPESTVFCAHRVGAEFITLTMTIDKSDYEQPVRIKPRIEQEHFFTVCLASLYGDEPKFIQISDFVEYYKLQGASFIHLYLRNVTKYDRRMLDSYARSGNIEVIQMHDNDWRPDFEWHNAQINDCHFRSKVFSKWTAFLDIDEKIEMLTPKYRRVIDYLKSITDPDISELMFRLRWVQKTADDPPKYINDEQMAENLIYRKFNMTSTKVMSVSLQPKARYKNTRTIIVNSKIALIRHYRNLKLRSFSPLALERINSHGPYVPTRIAPWLDEGLTKNILGRMRFVYGEVCQV
ncbi:unnamed protein product [Caenorhabditis bovis]|uniref:Glycosyltransferase family 92 protein n=1 Tax=Caenorhabditis bovis TaxID=2654633 RepID=A0A8S1E6D1_9PELO|nr:unnamed protein product [Caenorhabditis bovis]